MLRSYLLQNKKRGDFTLENFLKLIIAVICLGILFMLAGELYSGFNKSTKLTQATESLEEIIGKIEVLQSNNEIDDFAVLKFPRNWYILVSDNKKELCICEKLALEGEKQEEVCMSAGVCRNINYDIQINEVEDYSLSLFSSKKFWEYGSVSANSIKIDILNLVIQKNSQASFKLVKGDEKVVVNNVLDNFLKTNVVVLSDKTIGLNKEVLEKDASVEDLIKVICDNWDNEIDRDSAKADLQLAVKDFFSSKLGTRYFVNFEFVKQDIANKGKNDLGWIWSKDFGFYYSNNELSDSIYEEDRTVIYRDLYLDGSNICTIKFESLEETFE